MALCAGNVTVTCRCHKTLATCAAIFLMIIAIGCGITIMDNGSFAMA